jgi:hypothetical protein
MSKTLFDNKERFNDIFWDRLKTDDEDIFSKNIQ